MIYFALLKGGPGGAEEQKLYGTKVNRGHTRRLKQVRGLHPWAYTHRVTPFFLRDPVPLQSTCSEDIQVNLSIIEFLFPFVEFFPTYIL